MPLSAVLGNEMELPSIARHLLSADALPAVLATLVRVQGSSYRRAGARLLFTRDGRRIGSISGGCLESDLQAQAERLRASSQVADRVVYDTTSENDLLWGVGTGCHGVVEILLEKVLSPPKWAAELLLADHERRPFRLATSWRGDNPDAWGTSAESSHEDAATAAWITTVLPPPHLVVFGAGVDAEPLVALAAPLGWRITVADPRPGLAVASRFPAAHATLTGPIESLSNAVDWDEHTVAVLMTHHYRFDLPLLRALLPLNLPYLGLLGPRERGLRLVRDAGFDPTTDAALATLHSPVGLDLGGDGEAAVALSIVAGIQAALHGRSGNPLRERQSSIHAPDA